LNKPITGIITGAALFVAIYGLPPFTGGPSADYLNPEIARDFKTEVQLHKNGIYEVSVRTPMPGVSPEMVRWWFADYMQTTEHYKRWHPKAHIWMEWENKTPGEYIGASHLVHEYIGDSLTKLRIQFVLPEEVLGEVELGDGDVAICARAGFLDRPIYSGSMCHIIRSTDGGADMLSRFWLGQIAKRDGNDIIEKSTEGLLGNTYLTRRLGVDKSDAIGLMKHASEEMEILASFLPALYASETAQSSE